MCSPYDSMNSHSTNNNSQIIISLYHRIVANKSIYHTDLQNNPVSHLYLRNHMLIGYRLELLYNLE